MLKFAARLPTIHPSQHKSTWNNETLQVPIPKQVYIPMVQHIGEPCTPTVAKGDTVLCGQIIGDSAAYVTAPIHSSVSGIVTAVEPMLCYGNRQVVTVVIAPDGRQTMSPDLVPPQVSDQKSFIAAVRASGLTGLGGAGFPAHVKLNPPKGAHPDTFIVNAAECEPYITSDYRECVENTDRIVSGIQTILKWTGARQAIIAIEDNKPLAIEALKKAAAKDGNISVKVLKSRYPQGAERVLIHSVTGRRVKTGKLPIDVGCLVMNVTTVSFLQSYMETGIPLIKKRITVDGPLVLEPGNREVLIGMRLVDVVASCGGLTGEPAKVLMGGPLMGVSMHSMEVPIIKNSNSILVFDKKLGHVPEESACIRCGRCAASCPVGLQPLDINRVAVKYAWEELPSYQAMDCIECGNCSYVCPARRHLVQSIRLAKAHIRRSGSKSEAKKA